MAAERPTLPERLRALAGEPWPFPVPDPDFGMTGNVMREAAQRIEELEAQLAGVDSGTHTTNTHQPAAGVNGPLASSRARLTEAEVHARTWWCPHCLKDVEPEMVTKDGEHYLESGGCGRPVRASGMAGTFNDPERLRAWEEAGRRVQAEDDGIAGVNGSS